MKSNYTRQRQGRDFSQMPNKPGIIDRLRNAAMDTESNRNIDGTSGINKTIDDTTYSYPQDTPPPHKKETAIS